MTTLNARANQAWHAVVEEMDGWPFDSERDVFETGWESGYGAAAADVSGALKRVLLVTPEADVSNAVRSLIDQLQPDAHNHGTTGCLNV